MRQLFTLLIFMLTVLDSSAATISLQNPTALQRHEVVEIPCDKTWPQPMVIRDAFGVEQPYQMTHNGHLLLFASIRPYGTATYSIEEGTPSPMKSQVFVKLYPDRLDDIVIENDRGGYRFYGPALQRRGERGYGIDVWLKNTPELIIDSLYRMDIGCKPMVEELRRQGREREAGMLAVNNSFHINHGIGMDCYNVGPTLGCGTPALIDGTELLFPWCYDTYRIIENGPLRLQVQLDFAPTEKGRWGTVTEHRLVTLDRGSNFVRMKVWYSGLKKAADVAAGFVIHAADTTSIVLDKDFIHYADPTGDAERHNCQIYVATLFPEGVSETRKMLYDTPTNGNAGHAVGIRRGLHADEPMTYYFGAAWSQYDVRSQGEWQLRINDYLEALRRPIVVKK